ncbi:MAG: VWA domain-containing protein [Aquimonas sp.]|nr:VWA domain-containing protein [Aquimonas sp.]
MRSLIQTRPVLALACSLALASSAALAADGEQFILVLDASGSMWGQIDGRSKVEIARDTVEGVVRGWNPQHTLGLVAYGHRRRGDCSDIETLIEPGPLDAQAYLRTVRGLNARGMTPLSAAVVQAAQALRHVEQKATVILVSDGEETCGLDPCQVGRELEASGVDFTAHVIGFDVGDPLHQAQLRCLAENTGGRYFNARDAAELGTALNAVVAASSEPPPPPASASLQAPEQAPVVGSISVAWEGPGDEGDYISLRGPDGANSEHAYVYLTAGQTPVDLATASEPGAYVLEYHSPRRDPSQLASRPLQLMDIEFAVSGPDTAMAGAEITVRGIGPGNAGHWVGIADKGGEPNNHYAYHYLESGVSEYRLAVPGQPGDYELRVVLVGPPRVVASQPLRVQPARVDFQAPAAANAGATIEFSASGPNYSTNWISVAAAGSADGDYADYAYVNADGQYSLTLPQQAGAYELRFVLHDGSVAARQALQVR